MAKKSNNGGKKNASLLKPAMRQLSKALGRFEMNYRRLERRVKKLQKK